jgi:aspartate carbamoyltransferase catalytic subunit
MNTSHLIDIANLDDALIERIIDRAVAFSQGGEPIMVEHAVANLFFESSTRTRVSFEMAARRMGLQVINLDGPRSSMTKGESLLDTLATLRAMGIEVAVLRHGQTGICHEIVDRLPSGLGLINAGDGCGHHPTQALLDMATLIEQGIDLGSAKVVIIGDLRHSRVARSNIELLSRLSVKELGVAGPPALMPTKDVLGPGVTCFDSLDQALEGADVVMMLRVQKERLQAEDLIDWADYHNDWGLSTHKLLMAKPGCRVVHPGPINRGIELSAEVADGPQSLILDQVRMSVFTRMAIFEALLT